MNEHTKKRLTEICLAPPGGNITNRLPAYAEPCSDNPVQNFLFEKLPYFFYLVISELGRAKPKPAGVGVIFSRGYIFKILRAIIRFNPVLVVYELTFWARAEKCPSYQTVNEKERVIFGATDSQPRVASLTNAMTQDSSGWVFRRISKTSHSPKIRHLINSFVVGNVAPFFDCGKLIVSHDLFASNAKGLWLGSFGCFRIRAGRFAF